MNSGSHTGEICLRNKIFTLSMLFDHRSGITRMFPFGIDKTQSFMLHQIGNKNFLIYLGITIFRWILFIRFYGNRERFRYCILSGIGLKRMLYIKLERFVLNCLGNDIANMKLFVCLTIGVMLSRNFLNGEEARRKRV